ncbi:MAG: tail fiber domain-containing protein [Aestuariivirga sp.]
MAWYDTAGRIGLGIATGGMSEVARLPGVKDRIFGGDATKGISTKPQNYDEVNAQLGQIAREAGGRVAPQLSAGPQEQARQGLMDLTGRLGAVASGQQAGAGELAVNRQIGQANAAQMSAARAARGANSALASRNAARNQADIGLAGAGQAAAAQLQDQQSANAQLGQTFGQIRQGDIDIAVENMRAKLAQAGMNDQQQIAAIGQQLGWDQARINAELQRAAIAAGDKGMLPGLLQAGAQAGATFAASDERLKKDIRDGGDDADEMMRQLRPRSYRYKDESKWGSGERLGIMAQDLKRSKMGALTMIPVDDEGHMGFDLGKAASAALASVARLDERLRKVERK